MVSLQIMIRKIQNIWTLISLAVLLLVIGAILASRHDFNAEANDSDDSESTNYEAFVSSSDAKSASGNEELLARLDSYEERLLKIKSTQSESEKNAYNGETEEELLKQQDVLMRQISEHKSRAKDLKKELDKAIAESQSLRLELQTNKSENADDQSEEDSAKSELARYKTLVKNLTKDNLNLEAEIIEYKNRISSADQELSNIVQLKEKISTLESDNKSLKVQTKELLKEQKSNVELKNEIALLNDQILSLKAEKQSNFEGYDKTKSKLEKLAKGLIKKNNSLEETISTLKIKVEQGQKISREKELLLDKVAKSEAQIAGLNSEISKMVKSVNSFEKQNKSLQAELSKAKSFSRQLSSELADLEKSYDLSVKSNQAEVKKGLDLGAELAKAGDSIAKQKSEIEKLNSELKESKIATQQVNTQLAQTELVANRVPTLEKQIIELKNKLILNNTESELLGETAKSTNIENRKSYYAPSAKTNTAPVTQPVVEKKTNTIPTASVKSDVQLLEVISDKANLRVSAGLNNSVLMELKRGARLVAENKAGNWYRVVAPNGQRAFISSDVVRLVDSADTGIDIPEETKVESNGADSFDDEIEAFQKLKEIGSN
jgi:chromosome segregation ATPase